MANMFLMFYLSMIMFFFGCMVFVSNRKHLLSTLLSLEYMVLSLFIFLFFYLNFMNYEMYFSMFFLTFCVCEGVLGLSILVSMIRTHGNDYFQSFSILQC
uniref:NADH-ubiquinone oxidoreductase chain 4L n=3 Tax=Anopheles incertae sedis TaxID=190374 RepID=A0A343WBY0_9DIPT|nr:NADH dehydrogenase subunit 4L [Anopheles costai]YP_009487871.1 NADH dehydrogenase subunit 4L [Anopheles forattinii]YP_009487975.1 NADH dehydrogenase subunit 4L [Anopheles nr. costai SP02_17_3]AWB98221.1 NADH dehydrogenase subunit 4L [Anopheles costai]AWB98260.1 NADH dehydrogenase subunit 4L [Anopheles costai]AWB98351.1 NADH dehydrogenase subunit 4L [Anopheles costai]AWB98572.1 NADH dehydrogenase subunit 4L [Anopheles costai]AWB99001.1 NADH dehydrogenase subunit 4L [Anopheles forattinii]